MQKVGRLLNRYSEEVEVSDAINTLFEKKIIEYNEEKNTLTVNMDIKLKFKGGTQARGGEAAEAPVRRPPPPRHQGHLRPLRDARPRADNLRTGKHTTQKDEVGMNSPSRSLNFKM